MLWFDPTVNASDPSRLRIGFFTDSFVPQVNGVAISVALLADQLRSLGHTVLVFAPAVPGYRERDEFVYRLPSVRCLQTPPIELAVPGTPRAARSLSQVQLDIVHFHTPLTVGLMACQVARAKRLPLICTYHTSVVDYTHYLGAWGHGPLIERVARQFSAHTCNVCDQVVVPSAKFEKLLRGQHVRPPIQVVPNGIDLARFSSAGPRGAFRQKLGMGPDDPLLLVVGRLEAEKSLDFIIQAFAQVSFRMPEVRLVIAGDGGAREALQGTAENSGAGERIVFTGLIDRPELPALLRDADLFLSASTTEVHSLAMIEAIASGLPVVAVRDEALQGMVADGVNGRITPKDPAAFALAIRQLIAEPGMRNAFGQASIAMSRKYSVEAQAATLVELYTKLVGERGAARAAASAQWPTRQRGPAKWPAPVR